MSHKLVSLYIGDGEYYTRTDADNVIAELKKQVHDYAQGLYVIQARAEKELRRQKYKRCLAMAALWSERIETSTDLDNELAARRRWHKWLDLSEKFKPNN